MNDKITSSKTKYTCIECENENTIPDGAKVGDVIECEFCGLEFEIVEKDADGNFMLVVMEEEK